MRRLLCVLLLACSVRAASYVTIGVGNWSNHAIWSPDPGVGNYPGVGDVAVGSYAVTVDVPVTIGQSAINNLTGTGTVTSSGTTVTGSGTVFSSQLQIGDIITIGSSDSLITAIASDTSLTIGDTITQASGVSFTYRHRALYLMANLTVAAGQSLDVLGDLTMNGSTLTLGAGATLTIDGSAHSQAYIVRVGGVYFGVNNSVVANGTAEAPVTIKASNGGYFYAPNNISMIDITFQHVHFSGIGSASTPEFDNLRPYSGHGVTYNYCTFTNSGQITTGGYDNFPAAANFTFTNNRLISLPAGVPTVYDFLVFGSSIATGTRMFTGNSLALASQDAGINFTGGYSGTTVAHNVFARMNTPPQYGPFDSFDDNLFYVRHLGATTDWSFVGNGGDTLSNLYFLNDEGAAQANDHQLMANDSASAPGTWKLTNYIFERSGNVLFDVSHMAGNGTILYWYDRVLALPNSAGLSPGYIRARGGANTTVQFTHDTLMTSVQCAGVCNDGAIKFGSGFTGYAGMVAQMKNNLGWSKAAWASAPNSLYVLGSYDEGQGSPTADLLISSQVLSNAHYNASVGTIYDQNGANGTAARGYDDWRQTTKPTLATDINLGSGTSEHTQGPRFVDPTRNIATFDSSYLGNTATAWVTGYSYSVGDIASTSSSGFYGGATVNFRCVTAHTSSSGNATNGQPGVAANYRTNWEFESIDRIRAATVAGTLYTDGAIGCTACTVTQVLSEWVRAGFSPMNPALWCSAADGESIGAVPFCAKGKALLGAMSY